MKKNWKKVLVGTLCLVGFLLLLVKGNQFEKVSLISTEGQSYEKAVVTKITKDNLAEDGNRYGTQEVRVQVKSGNLSVCTFFLSGDMYYRWEKRSQSHCKSGIYRCVYCLSDVSADVPGYFTDRYYHCCCHSLDIADPVAFGRSL